MIIQGNIVFKIILLLCGINLIGPLLKSGRHNVWAPLARSTGEGPGERGRAAEKLA
jgi:hypothetical protein